MSGLIKYSTTERLKVGFTGTQQGGTPVQVEALANLLYLLDFDEGHHGQCHGADEQFHNLLCTMGKHVIVHSPINTSRMFNIHGEDLYHCILREPKAYLRRNHDIVDETDILIALPKGYTEELRSGTWATVRYARKKGRKIYMIKPDGFIADFSIERKGAIA